MTERQLIENFNEVFPYLVFDEMDDIDSDLKLSESLQHFMTLLFLSYLKERKTATPGVARSLDKDIGGFNIDRGISLQEIIIKDNLTDFNFIMGKSDSEDSDLTKEYRNLLLKLSRRKLNRSTDTTRKYVDFLINNFDSRILQKKNGILREITSEEKYPHKEADCGEDDILLYNINQDEFIRLTPLIIKRSSNGLSLFSSLDNEGAVYREFQDENIYSDKSLLENLSHFYVKTGAYRGAKFISDRLGVSYGKEGGTAYISFCKRGSEYALQGRYHLAASAFEKAMSINDEHPALYYDLSTCYLETENYSKNVSLLKKLISKNSEEKRAFIILGDQFADKEEYSKALRFYERAKRMEGADKELSNKIERIEQKKNASKSSKSIKKKEKKSKKKSKKDSFQPEDFLVDMLKEAKQGLYQPLVGREEEINQLVEILLCRNKKNALILGEPGVGKTALVEELALHIYHSGVPKSLRDIKLYKMSVASVLAGSKLRGQFEERMLKLIEKLEKEKCILFIDDLQTIISTGLSKGGSMDTSSILKPALMKGKIQIIGTSGYDDYRSKIEKEPALDRCFQLLKLEEPDNEYAKEIMRGVKSNFESFHNVVLRDEVIEQTLELIKMCITERCLPDKALDVYDRAAAKVKLKHLDSEETPEVETIDIYEAISELSGIPTSKVAGLKDPGLKDIEEKLSEKIIGQNKAIKEVAKTIRSKKMNLSLDLMKPDGVFLFIGPTGVGKTELAKVMAEVLFGSEERLVRIDMSEYMEQFSSSRLIGSSPGYVGYSDENQLTDVVRKNPYSLVLLDEIEKADSNMINLFLQLFDAGRLTDGEGRTVRFNNTTIVMTSNIGTEMFSEYQLGYGGGKDGYKEVSETDLNKRLKDYFPPEFLNRIDETVFFDLLEKKDVEKIARLKLKNVKTRMQKEGKNLIIESEVFDYLSEKGYSVEFGARNLERVIRREILDSIAMESLGKNWEAVKTIRIQSDGNDIEINLETEESPEEIKLEDIVVGKEEKDK